VIESLERRRPRYVVLMRRFLRPGDPIAAYIEQHYRCRHDALCVRADAREPETPGEPAPRTP
jgi:hypothetical protein